MTYKITLFRSEKETKEGIIKSYENFEDLAGQFKSCRKGKKLGSGFVRCETIERKDSDCKDSNLIIIDGDSSESGGNAPKPERVHKALIKLGYKHFIYTSHSHCKTKNKYRVVISADGYGRKDTRANNSEILAMLKAQGCSIKHVKEMDSFSQIWFMPRSDDKSLFEFYFYNEGKDWESLHVEESETENETKEEETSKEGGGETLDEMHNNIRTGKEYHESLRSLSYQYVKDGMSTANVKAILKSMMNGSKDSGSKRWQTRYDDIDRLVDGITSGHKIGEAPDLKKGSVPSFPTGVMKSWPMPWPMIYEAYESVARDPVEELLVPTILSTMAHMLNNKYITMEGKLVNLIFLNLASSGVGKDANTTSIIRALSSIFQKRDSAVPIDPFNRFLQFDRSLTSDTAFMQCFNEDGDFFWINTEATRIFELMGQKGNASVAGISDKLVEVGDGMGITTKRKVGSKDNAPSQDYPNCQVLLCAQPDTISDYLTHSMVDSGLFGRPLVSISACEIDLDEYDMFGGRDVRELELSHEFIEFILHVDRIDRRGGTLVKQIPIGQDSMQIMELNKWMRRKIIPYMGGDETLMTVLRRMGIPIEQVYTVIVSIINEWQEFKGINKTKRVSIDLIIPLLDFWVECKVYAVNHLIKKEVDVLASSIESVMAECLNGGVKMSKVSHANAIKDRMVPIAKLCNVLQNRTKLLRELEISTDKIGLTNRIKSTINSMVELEIIIKCKSGGTACVAFPR